MEAAKTHFLKLRQQVGQKDEAKVTRKQNLEEYRHSWAFSAASSTDISPIEGPSPIPSNVPLVRLSPKICASTAANNKFVADGAN